MSCGFKGHFFAIFATLIVGVACLKRVMCFEWLQDTGRMVSVIAKTRIQPIRIDTLKQFYYTLAMKNTQKSTESSASKEILNKIKKLKIDTLYPVGQIAKSSDQGRVYLSRLADRGEIIKVKRGFFYKPTNKTLYRASNRIVKLDKSLFVNDLFWSVKDGFAINADDLIKAYLLQYTEEDLMGLYTLFGYKRLLGESLKIYKKRTDGEYKKIRAILERFEEWRLHDKRD